MSFSLPEGWERVNLFDICKPKQWKTISIKNLKEEGYTVYGANGKIGYYSTYTHENPTLMITCRGATCGNIHISEPFSYINGNAMALDSLVSNIDLKFLYYFLLSRNFSDVISGSAQPQITREGLRAVEIIYPPLTEQKQIAKKLDKLLARVERIKTVLDNAPAKIKRFRQSVLADATSGNLTSKWREENKQKLEECQYDAIYEFNDKKLMKLPFLWKWTKFKNIAEIKSNLVDPLLTPNDYHIAPNHIESGTGKLLEYQTILEDNVKSGKHKFYAGQILYSKIRPYLNKVCIVDFNGLCSADMYPIESKIDIKYLYFSMLSNQFSSWTATLQGRVVLPKINQKALNTIPISVPPLEEQKAIVKKVETLFAIADKMEANILEAQNRVDKLTQSILAKAFCGEL